MSQEELMHAQTEFPSPEIEMYISDNNSNYEKINSTIYKNWNNSIDPVVTDYYFNTGVVTKAVPETARGVTLVIYIAIGLAFNTFMVVAIVPNRRLRTMRNILLVHLGCTGLIFTICINVVTSAVSFTGKWIGGLIICQIYGFILMALTFVTSWTITALSWDKYQTIACPLNHPFTAKALKLAALFGAVWLLACVLSLPPLLGDSRFVFHPEKGICFVCTSTLTGKIFIFLFILAAIYVPLGIMVFCYLHIYKIAKTQSSRIAATMIQMTCVIQATGVPSSQTTSLSVKGTKAMCTIFQLIGSFVLVYVPMSVILLIEVFSPKDFHVNEVLSSTIIMLFLSAPVIHSSVYGLRNKTLRMSFRRYMRRKMRYYCYKDKRKNSVKSFRSFRSTSFKAGNNKRSIQNRAVEGALRRTQSFPVRGSMMRNGPIKTRIKQNGVHLTVPDERDSLTRPHSYNVLNPEPERVKFSITPEEDEPFPIDIPHIDDDSGDMC
ncbi:rhodopsin, GQ-coupled-like [Mya arenaria]|uniref:rhodopsin, GQ-coupled-like n=1 Tax=Mya arenaria TaxID=6604 RepID=UPI0022E5A64C|nr:rhodopsin, GQ-coupled-like [Mya arenaria]XP_052802842.1 rhodopsin, GQ-coupled-like [Mya arenaria]XP_052802844.1 rhodopsin, GQ-coupled-like [Mya arenaria]XP_052802845.1 rhodopsin, GQ-coupled-like [Mya arenaria]XP_052802846.1 rhodopsin, GQ-coupled-like [Mya arenaria]